GKHVDIARDAGWRGKSRADGRPANSRKRNILRCTLFHCSMKVELLQRRIEPNIETGGFENAQGNEWAVSWDYLETLTRSRVQDGRQDLRQGRLVDQHRVIGFDADGDIAERPIRVFQGDFHVDGSA